MKFLIVFALVIVAALAAPADDVQILKNDFENIGVDGKNTLSNTSLTSRGCFNVFHVVPSENT